MPAMTKHQEIATEALCLRDRGFAIAKRPLVVDTAHGRLYLVDDDGAVTNLTREGTVNLSRLYAEVYEGRARR